MQRLFLDNQSFASEHGDPDILLFFDALDFTFGRHTGFTVDMSSKPQQPKQGKWMTEQDAMKAGYRAASNE